MRLRRRTLADLALLLLILVAAGAWLLRGTFRTPEGAAVDAYIRDLLERGGEPDSVFAWHAYINVPPDARPMERLLTKDLGRWFRRITVFRDTAWWARTVISEDSLKVYQMVLDVRPDPFPRAGLEPGDTPYFVNVEGCRTWKCHGGSELAIVSRLGRFRSRTVLSTWAE